MNISEHFTLDEATQSQTALRKGIVNTPSQDLIENIIEAANRLEDVRELLGQPIIVSSWFRCQKLNSTIGGSSTSAHTQGWAVDFVAPAFGAPLSICQVIRDSGIDFDQLIYEGTWVHISFEPRMRRQVLTATFSGGGVTYKHGLA